MQPLLFLTMKTNLWCNYLQKSSDLQTAEGFIRKFGSLRFHSLLLMQRDFLLWLTLKMNYCGISVSPSHMHWLSHLRSSSSTADCCWTWSQGSVRAETTSVSSDPLRWLAKEEEFGRVWRDWRAGTQERGAGHKIPTVTPQFALEFSRCWLAEASSFVLLKDMSWRYRPVMPHILRHLLKCNVM